MLSNKKRLLVTGSNGLLGQKLVHQLRVRDDIHLLVTSLGENRISEKTGYIYESLDISKLHEVQQFIEKYRPDCIIHTAAMTNVDACELHPESCKQTNELAVSYFIQSIQEIENYHPHFILLSTDFVFDGTQGPYKETDKPNPLSIYASSKYRAEMLLSESSLDWAIVRTIIVYGVAENLSRSNIVVWGLQTLREGKEMRIVNDQFRTPTLAEDLAQGCIAIADKRTCGIYHISGSDFMSIYEMMQRIARFVGADESLIIPVSSKELSQPARRPPRTGFDLTKSIKELDYAPHTFEQGLVIVSEQLAKQAIS